MKHAGKNWYKTSCILPPLRSALFGSGGTIRNRNHHSSNEKTVKPFSTSSMILSILRFGILSANLTQPLICKRLWIAEKSCWSSWKGNGSRQLRLSAQLLSRSPSTLLIIGEQTDCL